MRCNRDALPFRYSNRTHNQGTHARFVQRLYGTQAGYAEIIAGHADATRPDKINLDITTRRWLYVHPERPDLYDALAAYGQQLAHTHGNVYVGVRLYTKQAKIENTRKEAYTLPSTIIFIDDAPADSSLPYSFVVQTSAGSRHGYYDSSTPTPCGLGTRSANSKEPQ